ncbi:MAG: S8 family serine peptidase, partial [Longimicrobiales bacterium]|nr:S8 family serine peptidase [Longimicrobiales bacterium]
RGSGSYSNVIAGVDYVAANGASGDVANMSLGGPFSQALNDAVVAASARVKFALAAGNESTSATTRSPASANGPNIYTVSAFANGDTWASFSNFGNPPVDFGAPGVSILSTYKGGAYATFNGTSMASPHVAGILLMGSIRADGTVSGDPDGIADRIAHR